MSLLGCRADNSCIFFFIGEFWSDEEGEEFESWTTQSKQINAFVQGTEDLYRIRDLEVWQQYVVCLYWTVTTMATIGLGDITPKTVPEVAFTLLVSFRCHSAAASPRAGESSCGCARRDRLGGVQVLLQGGATFSYMVGNMATLISRSEPLAFWRCLCA